MLATNTTQSLGSTCETSGIRVVVEPSYLLEDSEPSDRRFVFAYRIVITNNSERTVKLLARHWVIVDANGQREDVKGDGVVGQQPRLKPGQSYEYSSFCPLRTPWGTMQGTYTLVAEDGQRFEATVGRFYLVCPDEHRR